MLAGWDSKCVSGKLYEIQYRTALLAVLFEQAFIPGRQECLPSAGNIF